MVSLLLIARWLHFAAVSALFGAALFWLYGAAAAPHSWPRAVAATRRLLRAAAVVAAVSGLAWLALTLVAVVSDPSAPDWGALADPQTLRSFFLETDFGAVWIVRGVLLAAALCAAFWAALLRAVFTAFAIIGALLLASQAWLGHAAQGEGPAGAAMIVIYGAHVLAAATWVGALAPLLFVLAAQQRTNAPAAQTLAVLSRFSAVALAAVAALALSGAGNLAFRIDGAFAALFDTAYGQTLAVKLALVAAMLGLAAANRFGAMPPLRADGRAPAALYGFVAAELALGVLVFGAAALLGVTPPPR